MIRSVLMSALLAAGLTGSATAETITVCAKGCDYTSINTAIDAASNGDVIQLAAETYLEGSPVDTAGKAIMIRGARGKLDEPLSILDGAGSHGVIRCTNEEGNDTIFENLVVRNGRAGTDGGGMYNYERSNPSVSNCRFENNRAIYSGGAIYNFNSSPVLTDCFFVDNIAAGQFGWGGAITSDGGSPSFTNCTFTGNVGEYGGAIHNIGSHPAIFGCTFIGNSASLGGGGMYNRLDSSPTLTDCTFTECCQVDPPRSFVDAGGNDYESWCDDCRADVNCRDNEVNSADLGYMLAAWGTTDPQCDLDGDGVVRAADLGLLLGYWGPCD